MASAQMALPVDRRNGASAARPAPPPAVHAVPEPFAPPPAAVNMASPSAVAIGEAPRSVRRVTTAAVLAVALVAALASYEHMRALAALAGESWRSWLLPVSVDGLAVAASMTMLVRRRAGERAGPLAWAALLLGLGASLAANVAAAEPTVQGRLVAAWPPVALLLSYELLMQQIKARGGAGLETVRPGASNPSGGTL
jgi:Protein of unknown function (DUF2637)